MGLLVNFSSRVNRLARFIEQPKLLALRQRGGLPSTFDELNQPWFHELGIRTVFDVGANIGQFGTTIRSLLPEARIFSFEPVPSTFAELQLRTSGDERWQAFNLGLGDQVGELTMEQNEFSPSSSFLKVSDWHKSSFPETEKTHNITVKVERLDAVAAALEFDDPVLLKLDVQGYEAQVMRGADALLKRARVAFVETCLVELYEGQALFAEIFDTMRSYGFTYCGAFEQTPCPKTGRLLFADSLFVRRPAL